MIVGSSWCIIQVICWDRGRLARLCGHSSAVVQSIFQAISRFALIAGEAPMVPENHLIVIEVDAFCFSESSIYNFLATENLNHNLPKFGLAALALKSDGKGARTWRFS